VLRPMQAVRGRAGAGDGRGRSPGLRWTSPIASIGRARSIRSLTNEQAPCGAQSWPQGAGLDQAAVGPRPALARYCTRRPPPSRAAANRGFELPQRRIRWIRWIRYSSRLPRVWPAALFAAASAGQQIASQVVEGIAPGWRLGRPARGSRCCGRIFPSHPQGFCTRPAMAANHLLLGPGAS